MQSPYDLHVCISEPPLLARIGFQACTLFPGGLIKASAYRNVGGSVQSSLYLVL